MAGITTMRVENGSIVESWMEFDILGLLAQISESPVLESLLATQIPQVSNLVTPSNIESRSINPTRKHYDAQPQKRDVNIISKPSTTELTEPLPKLAEDEQVELDAFSNLPNNALWKIAREQMPHNQQERLQVLMDGNSMGTLSGEEFSELENLVEQGTWVTLRKAKAADVLTERGYRVTPKDMTTGDE
jgi:hypothetical protein